MGKSFMGKSYWMKDDDQQGNFTNDNKDTFDPKKRYIGVRLQQGVPLLDRDWNELEDIRRYEEMITRKYYIGNVTPDDGFEIHACETPNDFKIGKGRFLVDGFEVVNEPEDGDHINYTQQTVAGLVTPDKERTDIVYLDVWIEEVKEEEDPDLGNPEDLDEETAVRHRINWCVKVSEGHEPEDERFHHHCWLAKIKRKNEGAISAKDIVDWREHLNPKWNLVKLENGWVNPGEEYNTASYFRDRNGIVHLSGEVKNSDDSPGEIMFKLKDHCRPGKKVVYSIATWDRGYGSDYCVISDTGDVSINKPQKNFIYFLDGISFRAVN